MSDMFGLNVRKKKCGKSNKLPLYLIGNYEISDADISGFACVILRPFDDPGTVDTLKKHMMKITDILKKPVAFEFSGLSAFRRKSLIKNNIPFITQKQAFLPFMGTFLQQQEEKKHVVYDTFTAAAQAIFIKWLISGEQELRTGEIAGELGYTAMTASRAVGQIEGTGCFELRKNGMANVLIPLFGRKELFEKIKRFLASPVLCTGYADMPCDHDLVVAGTDAVAQRTMLNAGRLRTFAAYEIDKKDLRDELVDVDVQAYVEIWKYDPKRLLWKDGCADPVSVALSLSDEPDERVEGSVEDMLEKMWREIDG